MAYLIGTDEAGYGPNLGPLVIAATVWRIPTELLDRNLYTLLKPCLKRDAGDENRLAIADSKLLYKPAGGLELLERGALWAQRVAQGEGASTTANPSLSDWQQLWPAFDPKCVAQLSRLPWYREYQAAVPRDADAQDIDALVERWHTVSAKTEIALEEVRCRVVFAEDFNQRLQEHGNKASALSNMTLELVSELLQDRSADQIVVHCDKHGGRNKYGRLLQILFPENLVEVHREGTAESRYRWGPADRRISIRFVAKGDRFLPSALASMVAKYLRERAMEAFNAFWRQFDPELRPTAGYPTDARRFVKQIRDYQNQLDLAPEVLWRER